MSNLQEYGISTYWVESGVFFTDEEAKSHLARNAHHYSSDACTYVKHAWRAPEFEKFVNALFEHFKVQKGKYK